jgi:hypothetical protein
MQAPTSAAQYDDLRERRVDFIYGRLTMPIEAKDLDAEILFEDPLIVVQARAADGCDAARSNPPNLSTSHGASCPTTSAPDYSLRRRSVRGGWECPGLPSDRILHICTTL